MESIGLIRTPFTTMEDMPIQPRGDAACQGRVVVNEEYQQGLADLAGFSHIYLLYHFHQASRTELTVTPFMDNQPRGVFATRSPLRPNHIGLSIVEVVEIQRNIIIVANIDVLDKTPLLDIKPYINAFDRVEQSKSGWMQASEEEVRQKRSDNRFSK